MPSFSSRCVAINRDAFMDADTPLAVLPDTQLGRLLAQLNYTTLCVLVLGSVAVAALVFCVRHGRAPRFQSLVRVAEACGVLVSGVVVGIVFLFTEPPAVELLSHEARAMAGFASLFVSVHVAFDTIWSAIWKRRRQTPQGPAAEKQARRSFRRRRARTRSRGPRQRLSALRCLTVLRVRRSHTTDRGSVSVKSGRG